MTLDRRPDGLDDDTVTALGRLSEALEWVERARGRLYDFHQMSGHADLLVGEAVDALREAGHDAQADRLERELVGRNVVEGRWTFQLVEEYDDTYWSVARDLEAAVRDELADGVRHVHEAEMKADRITPGHPRHRPTPADVGDDGNANGRSPLEE
ncbi:hypothetical protein [Salsipaludibacter albus]|uniref:hypothetical protein n=1 Tax=Salsipaludibacter albus TaxID=2849650 RepID=UPI001EE44B55|nr:hypothetical protein [Salsipaludibacter albus]